jgi:hypothetical protein
MPTPTSLSQIDLTPATGKQYFTLEREWREEFIYFLMVDRFHDAQQRAPALQPNRSAGIQTPNNFYGGKIKGITDHLDYIAGLGCTAIWLSPVFENNPGAYHGYDINNYLNIDPNFGTKQDLIDLVDAAHSFQRNGQPWPMRVAAFTRRSPRSLKSCEPTSCCILAACTTGRSRATASTSVSRMELRTRLHFHACSMAKKC